MADSHTASEFHCQDPELLGMYGTQLLGRLIQWPVVVFRFVALPEHTGGRKIKALPTDQLHF